MYIVAFDHPYYPEVYYCATVEEAHAKVDKIVNDNASLDGHHEGKITIATVMRTDKIRCDY